MNDLATLIRDHWVKTMSSATSVSSVRCMKPGCDWEGRFPGDIADHITQLWDTTGTRAANPGKSDLWAFIAEKAWDEGANARKNYRGELIDTNPYRKTN